MAINGKKLKRTTYRKTVIGFYKNKRMVTDLKQHFTEIINGDALKQYICKKYQYSTSDVNSKYCYLYKMIFE